MPGCAIVTGGTFGIGRAITLALAERGHAVLAFGLDGQTGSVAHDGVEGTHRALEARGLSADLLDADVSKEEDVAMIVEFALHRHGGIAALVNNAAVHPRGDILQTSTAMWQRVLAVNLTGPFLMSRAVVPHMAAAGGGAIVNIGSGSQWGRADLLAYSASKGGLHALTMALARDHLHQHIRVNMVVPGPTRTGMTTGAAAAPGFDQAARTTVTGEIVEPEDVAEAVAFLLSPSARQISGTVLDVGCFGHQGGPVPQKG